MSSQENLRFSGFGLLIGGLQIFDQTRYSVRFQTVFDLVDDRDMKRSCIVLKGRNNKS
jgi:hypothetical protein